MTETAIYKLFLERTGLTALDAITIRKHLESFPFKPSAISMKPPFWYRGNPRLDEARRMYGDAKRLMYELIEKADDTSDRQRVEDIADMFLPILRETRRELEIRDEDARAFMDAIGPLNDEARIGRRKQETARTNPKKIDDNQVKELYHRFVADDPDAGIMAICAKISKRIWIEKDDDETHPTPQAVYARLKNLGLHTPRRQIHVFPRHFFNS